MARGLGLDFAARRGRPAGWQLVLLAAGLGALAWAANAHRQAGETRDRLQARVESLARAHSVRAAAPKRDARTEAQQAAEARALRRLELPWGALLATLQPLQPKNIALLGIEADGGRGQLNLTAEAADDAAMLAYYRQLQASPQLGDVVLTRHGYMEDRAATPLRFGIRARWRGAGEEPGR